MGKNIAIYRIFFTKLLGFLILSLFLVSPASAEDLTSTNFIIKDPVIGTGGGYSTATTFSLFTGGETLFTDVNSSLNFLGHYGFLYFPSVVVPPPTPPPTPSS